MREGQENKCLERRPRLGVRSVDIGAEPAVCVCVGGQVIRRESSVGAASTRTWGPDFLGALGGVLVKPRVWAVLG